MRIKQLGLKSQSLNNAETCLNQVNQLFWQSTNDVDLQFIWLCKNCILVRK